VIVSSVPSDDQATTPALFLTGKGNMVRDFTSSFTTVPGSPADTYALTLTPTQKERDYESLVLVVDRSTLRLRMLVTSDAQGGQSTFTFSNLKENVRIADAEFVFKIPRGVDVITDGTSKD
jgi:outer membrane lipoprotein-sorting protein